MSNVHSNLFLSAICSNYKEVQGYEYWEDVGIQCGVHSDLSKASLGSGSLFEKLL